MGRVFKATLDLLVKYKDQIAGLKSYNFLILLLPYMVHSHFRYNLIFYQHLWWFCKIYLFYFVSPEAEKEDEAEDDDEMDGFQTDDEDDGSEEMGVDAEDGDEADSIRYQKLAAQVHLYFKLDLSLLGLIRLHSWLRILYLREGLDTCFMH